MSSLTIDWDYVNRFERYARIFRTKLAPLTGAGFERIAGCVVADNIYRRPEVVQKLGQLAHLSYSPRSQSFVPRLTPPAQSPDSPTTTGLSAITAPGSTSSE